MKNTKYNNTGRQEFYSSLFMYAIPNIICITYPGTHIRAHFLKDRYSRHLLLSFLCTITESSLQILTINKFHKG